MQQRGREYRIRQLQRKKREAAKQFKERKWGLSDTAIGIYANTPTRCSCALCGNTRKHYGKTVQELSNEKCFNNDILDVSINGLRNTTIEDTCSGITEAY